MGKSPAFNQLRRRLLDVRSIFEAIIDSPFTLCIVALIVVGRATPIFQYVTSTTIPENWPPLISMAIVLIMTLYVLWIVVSAFLHPILIKIGEFSMVIDALGEGAADQIIALCGVENVPIGAILVLPLSPFVLLKYGLNAFCLIQVLFLLSLEILVLTSISEKVTNRLERSRNWFEKERSNGLSVEDFSDWLTEKYFEYWISLGVIFTIAVFSPQSVFDSLWLFWFPLFVQFSYYFVVYDPFYGGVIGRTPSWVNEKRNWARKHIR